MQDAFRDQRPVDGDEDALARAARAILCNRRLRRAHLPDDLFGEWAWDALLTLFVGDAAGRRFTGDLLARELACPAPTMMRWIQHLLTAGLVTCDGRRDLTSPLTLSAQAITALEGYLTATLRAAARPV